MADEMVRKNVVFRSLIDNIFDKRKAMLIWKKLLEIIICILLKWLFFL